MGALAGVAMRGAGRKRRAANVVRNFNKEQQIGAQDPLGFWDPLDYCKDEASFKDYRAKELKHGRLAMMGALGMLTQSLVQVPGMEDVPKSVNAIFVGNGMAEGRLGATFHSLLVVDRSACTVGSSVLGSYSLAGQVKFQRWYLLAPPKSCGCDLLKSCCR